MPAQRLSRRALVVVVVAAFALVAAALPGTQAHASPSVGDIESQLDQKWNQLEPLVEKYDNLNDQLKQNETKQANLNKQLAPLQTQVSLAQTRVGAMAAEMYMNGPGSNLNALLESGSPTALADELTSLDQVARAQQKTVDTVQQQVAKYASQKKALDTLVTQQRQQTAVLATQKKQLNSQIDELEKERTQAYGTSGNLGNLRGAPCPYTYGGGSGGTAAAKACSLIGHPYALDGAGPTYYDCSGLTMTAWRAAGVSLPHSAADQYHSISHVGSPQVGDLVFYNGLAHVAIYVGGGWVVHAPKPGDEVRMAQMNVVGSIVGYGRP